MVTFREVQPGDLPDLWALNDLPNLGATADPLTPLPLPPAPAPPAAFPDLADIVANFYAVGGDFLIGERNGALVAMGGSFRLGPDTIEIGRVRVHPACRREGLGAELIRRLEERAQAAGITVVTLNTATNMPEALAFYDAVGYRRSRLECDPAWAWTLQHFEKLLPPTARDER